MARSKTKVVFLPRWTDENPYLENLASALAGQGYSVEIADYPISSLPISKMARLRPDVGIIHLHWISPLIERMYWQTSPVKKGLKYLFLKCLMLVDINLAQARGVKVVWTVHNFVTHDSQDAAVELRLRRALAKAVDLLCFHSREAQQLVFEKYKLPADKRACMTQHACYGDYYDRPLGTESTDWIPSEAPRKEFVFLFFGIIRRYKGVQALIEAFSAQQGEHLRLIIAGKVMPATDEDWLRNAAKKDPRIIFQSGFVPKEKLAGLISASDAVVLPFAKTLSSGSALLAITFGKPLILPESARVFGVPGDKGCLYFNGSSNLQDALARAQVADLAAMGKYNSGLAKKLTWSAMADVLAGEYCELSE